MSIELKINADTPEELIATINGLATLGQRPQPAARATELVADEEREAAVERPTTRRGRPPKAAPVQTDTGLSEAEQPSDDPASAGSGPDADPPATSVKSDLVGDKLSQQIKEANAEAAAERTEAPGTITLEHLNEKFASLMGDGKKFPSMRVAQDFLKANYVNAAGEPVRAMRDIQTQDYARLWAALSE